MKGLAGVLILGMFAWVLWVCDLASRLQLHDLFDTTIVDGCKLMCQVQGSPLDFLQILNDACFNGLALFEKNLQ